MTDQIQRKITNTNYESKTIPDKYFKKATLISLGCLYTKNNLQWNLTNLGFEPRG